MSADVWTQGTSSAAKNTATLREHFEHPDGVYPVERCSRCGRLDSTRVHAEWRALVVEGVDLDAPNARAEGGAA